LTTLLFAGSKNGGTLTSDYEKEAISNGHLVYAGIETPANARICLIPEGFHR